MSKFNLKDYQKTNGDQHITMKLKEQHVDPANVITEKQLDRDRIPEKDVILEKLLDGKRLGSAETLTEKRLNDEKGMFGPHRNSDAYTGDINKLEEKRLKGDKDEEEKYEASAETPKKLRWWESLKTASKTVVAGRFNKRLEDLPQEGDLDAISPAQKFNMLPELGVSDEGDEGIAPDTEETNEFIGAPEAVAEEGETETEVPKDLIPIVNKEMTDAGIVMMKFSFEPILFESNDEIKEAALQKVLEIRPYLKDLYDQGLLSVNEVSNPVVKGGQGSVTVRLVGDEYLEPQGLDLFTDASAEEVDVGGTPTMIGRVTLTTEAIELAESDRSEFNREIVEYIIDSNPQIEKMAANFPEVSLEDSLNFSRLNEGEITFVVGSPAPDAGGEYIPETPEVQDEDLEERESTPDTSMPEPVLSKSLNFPITILSQSKDMSVKKN